MEFILFILALVIGGIASWQIFSWKQGRTAKKMAKEKSKTESTVLLERIEKVFKVVLAEGYFTEIYDHKSRKEFWGLFNSNKKALIVTKAKVSVGYDFSKMVMEQDEKTRSLKIVKFPEPQVISIDTDYNFYDIDQGWLHKFKTDDYTKILNDAKKLMREKALQSHLPVAASSQIELMMQQLAETMNWRLDISKPETLESSLVPLIEEGKEQV